jgi:hypothetical protein
MAKYNPTNATQYASQHTNYSSWKIQNELINCCSNTVLLNIISYINDSGYFGLMCDEARYITCKMLNEAMCYHIIDVCVKIIFRCFKKVQLTLCIRYFKNLHIFERFVRFVDVSIGKNAEALSSDILSFLDKYNILNVPIIAQSYDEASVMSGDHNGVQKEIKDKSPFFYLYTLHMAHRTNLVVIDTCKSIKVCWCIF